MPEPASEAAQLLARIEGRARALTGPDVDRDELDLALGRLREHFERLRSMLPERAAELERMAQSCGRPPHELLALDGGLIELLTAGGIERSLGIHVDGEHGSILGGAWSLPQPEAAAVALRHLDGVGWVFGLPGSHGFAGISDSGHAIVSNVLRPAAPGPGVVGSALLGELLAAANLADARALIERTPLLDGRNWMLADGREFLGFEQLGATAILTRVGHKAGHVHANHCFDPSLRQREGLPRSALSFRRLELASTIYVQRRPMSARALIDYFDEVEEAAFEDPRRRASTVLAVELGTGLVLWRAHARADIEQLTLSLAR